jgi:hypothetical protein
MEAVAAVVTAIVIVSPSTALVKVGTQALAAVRVTEKLVLADQSKVTAVVLTPKADVAGVT